MTKCEVISLQTLQFERQRGRRRAVGGRQGAGGADGGRAKENASDDRLKQAANSSGANLKLNSRTGAQAFGRTLLQVRSPKFPAQFLHPSICPRILLFRYQSNQPRHVSCEAENASLSSQCRLRLSKAEVEEAASAWNYIIPITVMPMSC